MVRPLAYWQRRVGTVNLNPPVTMPAPILSLLRAILRAEWGEGAAIPASVWDHAAPPRDCRVVRL